MKTFTALLFACVLLVCCFSSVSADPIGGHIGGGGNGGNGGGGSGAATCTNDATALCTLSATRSSSDAQFTAGNIASGVNILNVTGTYGPACTGNDTATCLLNATRSSSDADFTAANMKSGVNILNVTGTFAPACSNDLTTECALNATRSSGDTDFTAANVKNGVNILNVTGTYVQAGDITTGLIHRYTFDEASGTTAADSAGSANGTLIGGPVFSPNQGQINGSLFFDGINDYVDVPSPTLPTGDYTYSVWVNLPDTGTFLALLNARSANSAGTDELFLYITSRLLSFLEKNILTFDEVGFVDAGSWHFITLTRSSSTITLYIDGAPKLTTYGAGTLSFSTCQLLIGVDADGATCNSSLGNYYLGYLDDLRIYDRALSGADVQLLYNTYRIPTSQSSDLTTGLYIYLPFDETSGTVAQDATANDKDGVLTNGAAFTTSGCRVGAACLTLDGTDDYVDVASPGLPTNDQTYAAFVKFATVSNLDAIFTSMVSTASTLNELYLLRSATNVLQLVLDNAGTQVANFGPIASATDWQHVAFTRRGAYLRVFFNGVPVAGKEFAGTLNFGTCQLIIGADPDGTGCNGTLSDFFGGSIDDVRIYNQAKTGADIAAMAAM